MVTFNKNYFILTVIVFLLEVLIALYVNDSFIRPYLGDVLVVILIYFFIKSFFKVAVNTAALFVLIFSFTIEFLQYLNVVEKLGLEKYKIARIVIGTSFSWIDLLCYCVGIVVVLVVEKHALKNKYSNKNRP